MKKQSLFVRIFYFVACCAYIVLMLLDFTDVYKSPQYLRFFLLAITTFAIVRLQEQRKWAVTLYILAAACLMIGILDLFY